MFKNLPTIFTALALAGSVLLNSAAFAQDEAAAESTVSAKDKQYILFLGYMMGSQSPTSQLNFSEEEKELFKQAFLAGIEGQPMPQEAQGVDQQALQQYFQQRMMAAQAEQRQQMEAQYADEAAANKAKGKEYIEGLGEEWKELPSGVYYNIIEKGEEPLLTMSDTANVQYEGKLVDGTVFDESAEGQTVPFPLQGVIPGFSAGLQKIGAGGHIKLVIPADQAYGNVPTGPIPAGSTLIFDIQVEDIVEQPQQ